MEMMKTWCSEVNLNLESFLVAISWIKYMFHILFIILAKIWYKTKKNKINYFNFVLYYQIIRIVYFCLKTENYLFYYISWKFYTKKIEK